MSFYRSSKKLIIKKSSGTTRPQEKISKDIEDSTIKDPSLKKKLIADPEAP